MTRCLIVTAAAADYAKSIEQLAPDEIPATLCANADEAMARYDGETVLFGNPSQIAEIIRQLPKVAWVQSTWAGVTPLIECERRDYVLTGVKDVFGPQMSEYVFGYLLAQVLKIFDRAESQASRQWDETHSDVLSGKTLGILGTGSIARHIARTAAAFDMRCTGFSRSGSPRDEFEAVYADDQLEAFLGDADFLVSTLPDTPGTNHLLNAESLARLPDGACFVNVGRSNVVDDDALVEALNSGRLAGAALDVFDEEPIPDESPLWDAPNLRVTGHIAAISHPDLIVPIFIENYRRFKAGQALNYVVDFDAGY